MARHLPPASLMVLLVISTAALAQEFDTNAARQSIAFTSVTVIDATGSPPQPGMTLVVTGNEITALGRTASVDVPEDSLLVDATGKFLIPGLWDMHVHTLQSWAIDGGSVDVHETFFPLFVANGVTGVRDMNGDLAILERARQSIAAGKLVGPTVVAAGTIVDGASWSFGSSVVRSEAEGRDAVRSRQEAGADFVKVGGLTPREAYFGIADEARLRNIPLAGHVPLTVTTLEASNAGQKSIEHLDGVFMVCSRISTTLLEEFRNTIDVESLDFSVFWRARVRAEAKAMDSCDEALLSNLIAHFAANGTWHVPTLNFKRATAFLNDKTFTDDSRLKYIPDWLSDTWGEDNGLTKLYTAEDFANEKRVFARQLELVGEMHRAGVRLMLGTDTIDPYVFPGFSVHDELELFVEAGLTPMQALQTATRNPAEYLGRLDTMGTVAVGKMADLVLLDANPLEDIRNTRKIRAVVLRGRVLQRADLDEILAVSRAAAR